MTKELFEAIKAKLDHLQGAERRGMIEGLRYGFNLAWEGSKYGKRLSSESITREFFEWLNSQT